MSRRRIVFYTNLLFVTLFLVTLISALGTTNTSLGVDSTAPEDVLQVQNDLIGHPQH